MHLLLLTLLIVQTVPSPSTQYERYNQITKFDHHFSKYSKRFFGPAFDWHYFKAQAIAESGLEENARSPVGAVGIMQVMPQTFEEIRQKNPGLQGGLEEPRWNIAAGIWYDRQSFVMWRAPRPLLDKIQVHVRFVQRRGWQHPAGAAARVGGWSRRHPLGVDRGPTASRDGPA